MEFAKHQNDLRFQRKANRTIALIAIVSVLCNLLSLVVIFNTIGMDRTVIVPPSIDRSFWVSKDKASREYLEQMAAYVAWLMLDVTPSTVDWKRNALLDWVSPADHAAMKTLMDLEADRLRKTNASTSFLIQQLTADEKEQSVKVTGRLRRQINGTDVGEPQLRTYLAQFNFSGGRVHIQTFKEFENAQPGQLRVGDAGGHAAAR